MKQSKSRNRKQKEAEGKASSSSKYARKLEQRRKLAEKIGVADAPLPVLTSTDAEEETP
jgi:hypothetical protein